MISPFSQVKAALFGGIWPPGPVAFTLLLAGLLVIALAHVRMAREVGRLSERVRSQEARLRRLEGRPRELSEEEQATRSRLLTESLRRLSRLLQAVTRPKRRESDEELS
ncbi:MAG: hypothetical protein KDD47_16600 [Acidobacteria bacterium]|nr:hypothetical protein [Acidobacteriota bacterium]